ncbi:MAG: DUF502 domain-containing protein [Methylobacter sp.]|nr:DUF502 domain-containing protein [Methylobacter sp.]MDP2428105.1 DUF502 domain-containing protein [Methylobacter sp.]MDP3054427.1 DUF502 domain-containing protein [Methylobacter sp.]MDP3364336.1 DUF502 domain-containing protein [Methylobacter sp.]MDZ4220041.1 DUF502 domain-containing protein [Methylobacter sp.]
MLKIIQSSLKYFIVGVLAVIPVVIVIQVLVFLETIVRDFFIYIYGYSNNVFMTALAFTLSFVAIAYTGYRVTVSEKMWMLHQVELLINRIPVIRTIYRVSKKLVNLLGNREESLAKEIIFVEYPKDGLWVPAYVTNKMGEMLVVYVPTSPNPTSGFTIVVHQSKVVKSTMDIEGVSSFIVSVGVDVDARQKDEFELLGRRTLSEIRNIE